MGVKGYQPDTCGLTVSGQRAPEGGTAKLTLVMAFGPNSPVNIGAGALAFQASGHFSSIDLVESSLTRPFGRVETSMSSHVVVVPSPRLMGQ